MTYFISHIQIANAVLCLLMAAQLFGMQAMRALPKRLLALNCLLYAHQSIALVAILNGDSTFFFLSRPILALFLGPALFLYFASLQRPEGSLRRSDAWHLVGALTLFFVLFSIKPLRAFIDIAIVSSFVLYTLLTGWQVRAGQQVLAHLGGFAAPAYVWLKAFLAMAVVNIILEFAVNIEIAQGTPIHQSVSLLVASIAFFGINASMVIAAMQRSQLLEWMYQFGAPQKQAEHANLEQADNTHTTSSESRALFERWVELVQTEQLHKLEFGITLPQAARKLQVPARQLSNAVNQIYGKSFSTHLNDLRVEEAKRLLSLSTELSIIEVMHQAGFSTKSNFNKEFLRVTGMSPSAFREAHANPTSPATQA